MGASLDLNILLSPVTTHEHKRQPHNTSSTRLQMHDGASFNFALISSLSTTDSPRERKLSSRPTRPIFDASESIEEETLPNYRSENHYPAHIDQVLLDRYQIVGKLGYGVTSTVWIGRDLPCISPSATLNLLTARVSLCMLEDIYRFVKAK
ncbi:hypothetical protein I7I51_01163 [Histoplasma capsulatum]|uniref:Protein kinase domain-containing protein n=1 Tax=Ajellomyces capsulatus TaxID=5037 RepID=A0A8A1MDU9_AJECA|nr:hypothetical protein I7I51_01163 [Histoplasma capsulatum]